MAKQRYKIYDIENHYLPQYATKEGMQAWLDWICRTKWWSDRSKIKHVQVKYPVVGKMSGAYKDGPHLAHIDFGPFSLCQMTACHELAHILTWDANADDEEDHGPRFVGMYLSVVKRYMSADIAKSLAKDFDNRKVKYSAWE